MYIEKADQLPRIIRLFFNASHTLDLSIKNNKSIDCLDTLKHIAKKAKSFFDSAELKTSQSILEYIEICSSNTNPTITDASLAKQYIDTLIETLLAECSGRTMLFLSADKEKYLMPAKPIFGSEVKKKFPSTTFDILEASNCFALGRWNACVFHLMCVLEIALKIMAKELSVSFEHSNWQNILDRIESAVRDMSKPDNKPTNWKVKQEYYSQAISGFTVFKNAWRNYTAHARAQYTESDAHVIMLSVESFMQRMATKLQE